MVLFHFLEVLAGHEMERKEVSINATDRHGSSIRVAFPAPRSAIVVGRNRFGKTAQLEKCIEFHRANLLAAQLSADHIIFKSMNYVGLLKVLFPLIILGFY